jgi:hypothetical protein
MDTDKNEDGSRHVGQMQRASPFHPLREETEIVAGNRRKSLRRDVPPGKMTNRIEQGICIF